MPPAGAADQRAAATAFHGAWSWLATSARDGLLEERDGLLVTATGLDDPKLNPAFVVADPSDAREAIRWSAGARARGGRSTSSTGIDLPAGRWPGVEEALRDLSYEERVRRPAMCAAIDDVAPVTADGLAVRVVADEADWAAYVGVQTDVFGLRADVAREFPAYRTLSDPQVALLVGLSGGQVVATAAVFVIGEVAGLYAVATTPGQRRRGYGAAITAAAVAEAGRRGAGHVALQASPDGYPVYRRLGFRHAGDWVVWVDPQVEPATDEDQP